MSKCLSNAVWESESYNASPSAIIALCAENVGHTQPHICMQSPFFIQITCDRVSRAYLVVRLSSVSQPNSQFQFVFCNEMMVKFEFKMQLCATCLIGWWTWQVHSHSQCIEILTCKYLTHAHCTCWLLMLIHTVIVNILQFSSDFQAMHTKNANRMVNGSSIHWRINPGQITQRASICRTLRYV